MAVEHQAAGLQQARFAQRRARDQDTRAQREQARRAVGLVVERAPDREHEAADLDAVAGLEPEALQQQRIHERAEMPLVLREQSGQGLEVRTGAVDADRPVERIEIVDALELDQQPVAAGRAGAALHVGHRAQLGDRRDVAALLEPCQLGRAGRTMHEVEGEIAAEQLARVAPQPVFDRARERADAGDGRDPEREAREHDAEPLDAAAQLAAREREGQRDRSHCAASAGDAWRSSPTTWPFARRTTRPQRRASARSCVISTSVVPSFSRSENSSSIT